MLRLDRLHFRFEQQIQELHDHLYGNANLRTPDAIGAEVSKIIKAMMFVRGSDAAATDDGPLPRDLLRDSTSERARTVATETHAAFDAMNQAVEAYPRGTRIELDDSSVVAVRVYLSGFDFDSRSRDWLGDAIEIFRSLTAKRLGGQFFTHPLVTELAMTLLEYRPFEGDDLVDICAGSGGFLLAGGHAMAIQQRRQARVDPKTLIGLEADPELVRLTNANLAMQHGESGSYAMPADSLASPDAWPAEIRRRVIPGTHRCLASNPPFGTKITVKDDAVLRQYDLGARWSKSDAGWTKTRVLTPRAPDILFLERNLQLAEPGVGRVALVTPYQMLSGPQAEYIRHWLLCNARVVAVIDLPPTTFQPHTGTKASLLVYKRLSQPLASPSEAEDYEIFMATAADIGHDRRGNPVFESGEAPVVKTDLYAVADAFQAFRRGDDPSRIHPGAFVVRASDVVADPGLRLNAAYHEAAKGEARQRVLAMADRPGWTLSTVGALTKDIFVPGRFKRNYVQGGEGVPFLSGTGISQILPNGKRLAVDDAHGQSCVVRSGWVLVTRSGSTGLVSSVPSSWDGWAVSDHVIRIVPDDSKLDAGYLQAYLRSTVGQELLKAGIFGSVIDEITPEHVASVPIPVPQDLEDCAQVADHMRRADEARATAHEGIIAAVEAVEKRLAAA